LLVVGDRVLLEEPVYDKQKDAARVFTVAKSRVILTD
jgi:hypothetical protein